MSQWYYKLGEDEHGPVSYAELVALVRAGRVTETAALRRDGSGAWARAWTVPMLFAAANTARNAAPVACGDSEPPPPHSARTALLEHVPLAEKTSRARSQAVPLAGVRAVLAALVAALSGLGLYRWSYWRNLAFPAAPRDGEQLGGYSFVVIGDCTGLECAILYFDVLLIVGTATWLVSGTLAKKYGFKDGL